MARIQTYKKAMTDYLTAEMKYHIQALETYASMFEET